MFKDVLFTVPPNLIGKPLNEQGQSIIKAERLTFTYPGGPAVIKNLTLEVHRGEFVAIMGRNASGKTTLIKHFNGILKPVRGKVKVDGIETTKFSAASMAKKVGFVSQNPNDHLFADTVEEELSFTLRNQGLKPREWLSRIQQVTAQFKLDGFLRRYPRSLSGGEKQRVALASVMVSQPEVLILDEPTRGMDYALKIELMQFLADYAHQGNAVVLVTHDVETAAEMADRVILMSEGEIVVDGSTRQALSQSLLLSPQINRLVQAFTGQGVPPDILTVEELLQVIK
jgi:energy-coupling factor transport system ATP-binding protein